jgi:hypothetical protein
MIDSGLVLLLCSTDLDSKGSRERYGGGFEWSIQGSVLTVPKFWVEKPLPNRLRLHLFGNTEANTVACLIVEIDVPDAVRAVAFGQLQREAFSAAFSEVLEYDDDIENVELTWPEDN